MRRDCYWERGSRLPDHRDADLSLMRRGAVLDKENALHVPSVMRPDAMGTVSLVRVRTMRRCDGMSSGPSAV